MFLCMMEMEGEGKQMSAFTHTWARGVHVCVISHTRKKRTTVSEKMRGL